MTNLQHKRVTVQARVRNGKNSGNTWKEHYEQLEHWEYQEHLEH